MARRVFLSHAMRDRVLALRLSESLRASDVQVFDPERIEPGKPLHRAIEDALAAADLFIFIDPGPMQEGSWTSLELSSAIQRASAGSLPILPILVGDGRPATDWLSQRFRTVTLDRDARNVGEAVEAALAVLGAGQRSQSSPSANRAKTPTETLFRLLETDLAAAPVASAFVVDELVRRAPRGSSRTRQRIEVLQRVAAWSSDSLGAEHQSTLSAMAQLARSLDEAGRYDEAALVLESSLEIARRSIGAESSASLALSMSLVRTLARQGDFRASRDVLRGVEASGNPRMRATAKLALAEVLALEGDLDGSWSALAEGLQSEGCVADDRVRVAALLRLAEVLADEDAFIASRDVLALLASTADETHDVRARTRALLALASVFEKEGRNEESGRALADAARFAASELGNDDPLTSLARERAESGPQ